MPELGGSAATGSQQVPQTIAGVANLLSELYRPIERDLLHVEQVFDDELRSEFDFVNQLCDTARGYRGKMMRPALLLLCGKACGGAGAMHHTLAAVVEMVHVATLVHDDVLDEARERRRRATVNSRDGNTTAVLLGDFLISHTYHLCSSIGDQHAARRIAATTNVVCEGELLQNHHRQNLALTEAEYLSIIERKTGALTATACELGGYYAGASPQRCAELHAYGQYLGVAFQIVDDLLDIVGNCRDVGKTLGTDAELGKLTLPVIHFLAQNRSADARELILAHGRDAQAARSAAFHAAGSLDYARSVASEFIDDALRQLAEFPLSDARSSLTRMAEFVIRRSY